MADIGICLRSHLLHTLPILHMYTIFLSLHIYTISHISHPQFSYLTHIHNFPILQMYTIPHFIHTYTLPILHTYTISPFFTHPYTISPSYTRSFWPFPRCCCSCSSQRKWQMTQNTSSWKQKFEGMDLNGADASVLPTYLPWTAKM